MSEKPESWWAVPAEQFPQAWREEQARILTSRFGKASVLLNGPNETTAFQKVMAQRDARTVKTGAYAGETV